MLYDLANSQAGIRISHHSGFCCIMKVTVVAPENWNNKSFARSSSRITTAVIPALRILQALWPCYCQTSCVIPLRAGQSCSHEQWPPGSISGEQVLSATIVPNVDGTGSII